MQVRMSPPSRGAGLEERGARNALERDHAEGSGKSRVPTTPMAD